MIKSSKIHVLIGSLFAVILLTRCGTTFGIIRLDAFSPNPPHTVNPLTGSHLSPQTEEYLLDSQQYALLRSHPNQVLESLDKRLMKERDRKIAFTLAEICYYLGKNTDHTQKEYSYYYSASLLYSYAFLFDPGFQEKLSPYHPRLQTAINYYNLSLQRLLSLASNQKVPFQKDTLHFNSVNSRKIVFSDVKSDLVWNLQSFADLIPTADYQVEGFRFRNRDDGVGVSLIALHDLSKGDEKDPRLKYLFAQKGEVAVPATAFLECEFSIFDNIQSKEGRVFLHVLNSLDHSHFRFRGYDVPLSLDFTTPLAYSLSKADPPGLIESLNFKEGEDPSQDLFMLSPYDPKKIPLVLVHGLFSSPFTWIPAVNDLLGNKEIREKYQIWFFWYKSGNPIPYSGYRFRKALLEVQKEFDPNSKNPKFAKSVLVGHSMGGLIVKMAVTQSKVGDWMVSDRMKEIADAVRKLPDDTRKMIIELFDYSPLPFVHRVVFIATPHGGSFRSDNWIAEFFSDLVDFSGKFYHALESSFLAVREKLKLNSGQTIEPPTGISNLKPDGLFIQVTKNKPIARGILYHSILADASGNWRKKLTLADDGFVTYKSAHLEGAESEFVVDSDHSVQKNPESISELERILELNLKER